MVAALALPDEREARLPRHGDRLELVDVALHVGEAEGRKQRLDIVVTQVQLQVVHDSPYARAEVLHHVLVSEEEDARVLARAAPRRQVVRPPAELHAPGDPLLMELREVSFEDVPIPRFRTLARQMVEERAASVSPIPAHIDVPGSLVLRHHLPPQVAVEHASADPSVAVHDVRRQLARSRPMRVDLEEGRALAHMRLPVLRIEALAATRSQDKRPDDVLEPSSPGLRVAADEHVILEVLRWRRQCPAPLQRLVRGDVEERKGRSPLLGNSHGVHKGTRRWRAGTTA
mmetsp:Transcript_13613/g.39276  ORF Transcript_13613/g.39276 Transcript_13613/m.39276 type:complete len:287 (-) Transcript_13613:32-892(-)